MNQRVLGGSAGGACAFVFAALVGQACAGSTNDAPQEVPDGGPVSYAEGGTKHDAAPPWTGSHDDAGSVPPPPGTDASPQAPDADEGPPADDAGPFFAACTKNEDCPHYNADAGPDGDVVEMCNLPVGDCKGHGTCLVGAFCQGVTAATCGCDGVTYPGPCAAMQAGASIAAFNACGDEEPDSGR